MSNEYETAADELKALMSGEIDLGDEEVIDGTAGDDEDYEFDEEIVEENYEGTDQPNEVDGELDDDEAEPNDQIDGEDQENGEDDDTQDTDEDEENTPVEDDDSKDDGDDQGDTPEDENQTETNDEQNQEDDDQNEDENQESDEVDYRAEYEKYKDFYDQVTADFKANGQVVPGFKDPKMFIQANQMAAGLSEKMREFKPYRPFMKALRENGILDNPEKFDLAMAVLNKDPEAIKLVAKEAEIDPLELDTDEIKYERKQYTTSNEAIVLDELYDVAKQNGVDARFDQELGDKWLHDKSLDILVKEPAISEAIIRHMSTEDRDGNNVYDTVNARVKQKELTDRYGTYSSQSSIEKYLAAAKELEAEEAARIEAEMQANQEATKQSAIEEAKARIAAKREQEAYKQKVEQEKKKQNEARSKAASLSKPKTKRKVKPKFDPIEESAKLEGTDFMDYFNKQIMGRKY